MSCKLWLIFDPGRDAHLRDQVLCWCSSSSGRCSVVDWTPPFEYGAMEQEITQAAMRQCDAVVVVVGQDTENAPNVQVEIEIARKLRLPLFQLVSPEATRRFIPGAGPALEWSPDSLLKEWRRSADGH